MLQWWLRFEMAVAMAGGDYGWCGFGLVGDGDGDGGDLGKKNKSFSFLLFPYLFFFLKIFYVKSTKLLFYPFKY